MKERTLESFCHSQEGKDLGQIEFEKYSMESWDSCRKYRRRFGIAGISFCKRVLTLVRCCVRQRPLSAWIQPAQGTDGLNCSAVFRRAPKTRKLLHLAAKQAKRLAKQALAGPAVKKEKVTKEKVKKEKVKAEEVKKVKLTKEELGRQDSKKSSAGAGKTITRGSHARGVQGHRLDPDAHDLSLLRFLEHQVERVRLGPAVYRRVNSVRKALPASTVRSDM
jgi:hypothetical protein